MAIGLLLKFTSVHIPTMYKIIHEQRATTPFPRNSVKSCPDNNRHNAITCQARELILFEIGISESPLPLTAFCISISWKGVEFF